MKGLSTLWFLSPNDLTMWTLPRAWTLGELLLGAKLPPSMVLTKCPTCQQHKQSAFDSVQTFRHLISLGMNFYAGGLKNTSWCCFQNPSRCVNGQRFQIQKGLHRTPLLYKQKLLLQALIHQTHVALAASTSLAKNLSLQKQHKQRCWSGCSQRRSKTDMLSKFWRVSAPNSSPPCRCSRSESHGFSWPKLVWNERSFQIELLGETLLVPFHQKHRKLRTLVFGILHWRVLNTYRRC